MKGKLLQLFPVEKRTFWQAVDVEEDKLQEIRLRADKPVILIVNGEERFLNDRGLLQTTKKNAYCVVRTEVEEILNHICHYSLYAYEDELRQGFLAVEGGHRVGVTGQVVQEQDGSIRTIKNITCLNIRIAHQMKGVADKLLPYLYQRKEPQNVLIISPPGCGKTTLLRDIIRQLSDGNAYGNGVSVGVVDERSEIAGSYQGIPQNDVGIRTDVLDACPKKQGMMMLLRSMSPKVIAIDELGGIEDMEALRMAAFCGVKLLATIHGTDLKDVEGRGFWENGRIEDFFDLFLILSRENNKPVIQQIIKKEEAYASLAGNHIHYDGLSGNGAMVQAAIPAEVEMPAYLTRDIGASYE